MLTRVLVFDVEFQADRDEGGSTATLKQRENSITITSPRRRVLNMSLQANSVLLRFPETVVIWGVESRRYASLKEPDLGSTTEVGDQSCRLSRYMHSLIV